LKQEAQGSREQMNQAMVKKGEYNGCYECGRLEKEEKGRTILHFAAMQHEPDKVRLLLEHNADMDVMDNIPSFDVLKAGGYGKPPASLYYGKEEDSLMYRINYHAIEWTTRPLTVLLYCDISFFFSSRHPK
jgi:hypothetical protein